METQESIAAWCEETFGPAPSVARIAARANEEMAELLRHITSGQDAEDIVEEAADVVIVLYRVAHILGFHLQTEAAQWAGAAQRVTASYSLAPPGRALLLGTKANEHMSTLLTAAAQNSEAGIQYQTGVIVAYLDDLASGFALNLRNAIDAKMKVNRGRFWQLDGTGHGYHKRTE